MTARSHHDDLALIALIGWSFLLRIPSECLPLCRQQGGEDLDPEERLARRAVIGLSGAKLAIKRNRRKHMASGSRLVRACICEDYARESLEPHIQQLLCPVCRLRPAIRQSSGGRTSLRGLEREESALRPTRLRGGTRVATRSKAGGPFL